MAQHSTLWQDVVTAALIGSERRPVTFSPSDDSLETMLAHLESSDLERTLLGRAAAISLYRRAGQMPLLDNEPVPEPCELDSFPRCNQRAGSHLALMLSGQYTPVLPEWLSALTAARKRIPEEFLPAMLEAGRANDQLRDLVLPALGLRGAWLAAQNPDWDYVVTQEDETIWHTGSRASRIAFLQRRRRRDPQQARELLAETWSEEAPKDRAEFLESLAIGLSILDEPFLESALDDRRKEVRQMAANLLARLPESRLAKRMIERLRPLVSFKQGLLGRHSIEITLPQECDKSMIRDCVEPKPPRHTIGQKAFWLYKMLSPVPPAFWRDEWSRTPEEIIRLALRSEWREPLLMGWRDATLNHSDADWANALLRWWAGEKDKQSLRSAYPISTAIILPQPRFESLALDVLAAESEPVHDGHPVLELIQSGKHNWGATLTRAIIESIRRRIERNVSRGQAIWSVRAALKDFALLVPPDLIEELSAGWPANASSWDFWAEAVDEFLALLQFRHDMLKEINE